jgi:hypothetical protein
LDASEGVLTTTLSQEHCLAKDTCVFGSKGLFGRNTVTGFPPLVPDDG